MSKCASGSFNVLVQNKNQDYFLSENDKILQQLHILEYSDKDVYKFTKTINTAFASSCAHVRAKCLDILALWCKPLLCLAGGSAGDLVLWHSNDGDARVRDRAYHCFLYWLLVLSPKATLEIYNCLKPNNLTTVVYQNLKQDIMCWFQSNLESVYAVACRGLLDNEELVRCTSLHVVGLMGALWSHRDSTGCTLSKPTSMNMGDEATSVRLVDDAFERVCGRMQDASRRVRQLSAEIMADLAKSVTEDCLLQTLEKTVMTDRQVCRSMQINRNTSAASAAATTGGSQFKKHMKVAGRDSNTNSVLPINLLSTGSNGALITGLEDDYFEVRCTTLNTMNRIALMNTRFAMNCQDLLVDMLTDDIQLVRFAAVRALGAVGNKVTVKGEQIAIITSALAESSGRIRRKLHHLLSQCRLASAPCLISLLDGLLQNLRNYPQDRDNLWCCAALVGRNHPTFVDICLSSLLRLHSWLNGPEPNKEDPAYLTVLLLVLNAEPSVPGMQSKFPKHLVSTRIYLHELLPSLLPHSTRLSLVDTTIRLGELDDPSGHVTLTAERSGLYKFVNFTVGKIRDLLIETRNDLEHLNVMAKTNDSSELYSNVFGPKFTKSIHMRRQLLVRLVFCDLCTRAPQLDRSGHLQGLIYWLSLIATVSWYLVSAIAACPSNFTNSSLCTRDDDADSVPQAIKRIKLDDVQSTDAALSSVPSGDRSNSHLLKLMTKAFKTTLKIEHFFVNKTQLEDKCIAQLRSDLFETLNLLYQAHSTIITTTLFLVNALDRIVQLLLLFCCPTKQSNLTGMSDLIHRLQPIDAILLEPSRGSTKVDDNSSHRSCADLESLITADGDDDDRIAPSRCAKLFLRGRSSDLGKTASVVPEVRFTATMASCSIRIRAVVYGVDLDVAR